MFLYAVIAILTLIVAILQLPKLFSKKNNPIAFVIALILFIICTLGIIKEYLDNKKNDKEHQELINSQQEVLKSVSKKDIANSVSEGFAFYMVLTTTGIEGNRRKFIFDSGNENDNRMSLYLDVYNNLIYRIIDEAGETYSLKIPSTSYTFIPGVPFFIYCDCGTSARFSFMRVKLNGKLLGQTAYETRIKFLNKDIAQNKQLIGCNINGNECGDFSLVEIIIFKKPLNEETFDLLFDDIDKRYLQKPNEPQATESPKRKQFYYVFYNEKAALNALSLVNKGEGIPKNSNSVTKTYTQILVDTIEHKWYITVDEVTKKYLKNIEIVEAAVK